MKRTKRLITLATAIMFVAITLKADWVVATWSGDGDSDNSGNWNNPDNWDVGYVPYIDVGIMTNGVVLPSVTSGTRTIVQDDAGGTRAGSLRFQQSGTDGINKLRSCSKTKFTFLTV